MGDEKKPETKPDIFFSYAGDDRESIARPLVRALRRAGLAVWYDEIDSPLRKEQQHPTEAVARMLHDAIIRSNQSWLLIGPSYRDREWTRYEALSLSALSACGIADLGVVVHGISDHELKSVLDDLRLDIDVSSEKVIRYGNDPQHIASHLLSFVEPRVNMVMMREPGPIDIAIFEQLGQVVLFTNGGLENNGADMKACDFCGHGIGKETNMDGLLCTFLDDSLDNGVPVNAGSASAINTIHLDGTVTLAILNHPNYDLYTTSEIELGVVQNFGNLFMIPAVTWGPVTVGYITHDPPEVVHECLKTISEAGIDEWSRIYFRDDGTFNVM